MLFDHFDRIRIIGIAMPGDHRAPPSAALRRLCEAGDPRVAFVDARRFDEAAGFPSTDARGLFHSHLAILEDAAAAGHGVLIVQDGDDLDTAAGVVRLSDDWQIFHGGADSHGGDAARAPSVAFRADVVPPLVAYLRDLLATDDHPPIHAAYTAFRRAHPAITTVFADARGGTFVLARGSFGLRESVILGIGGVAVAGALAALFA